MSSSESPNVEAWLDQNTLRDLVARLGAAVDRADRARIAACYTEDSYDDHGIFKGTGRDFADFICGGVGLMRTMHHQLGQSIFDVIGDDAWGETYFYFHADAGGTAVTGYGRYVDHFRRTREGWKVHYRRVVPDAVPPGDDIDGYWRSRRDESDPSHDRRRAPTDPPTGE